MIALLSLLVWIYLCVAHGKFWVSEPELAPAVPSEFPDVDIVVPARNEAQCIGAAIASLLAQDYAGRFRVILVDDNSVDGTAERAGRAPNLRVIRGRTQARRVVWEIMGVEPGRGGRQCGGACCSPTPISCTIRGICRRLSPGCRHPAWIW